MPEKQSKGEKINEAQKKEEKKLDTHNRGDEATHPHKRQYNAEEQGEDSPIKKLCVAESLTAGKLADLFASHNAAGTFYLGGMSVYTLQHKAKLLGVDKEHAGKVDCVSPKVAMQMAQGILKMFGEEAEVGVGVTGFAKTEGVEDLEPHAFFCVVTKEGEKRQGKIEKGLKGKDRNEVRMIVAERVYLETCKVIGLEPNEDVVSNHKDATIEEEGKEKTETENQDAEETAKRIDDKKEENLKKGKPETVKDQQPNTKASE